MIITDTNGDKWTATRCDYRHKGKRKPRYLLEQIYTTSGATVFPRVLRTATRREVTQCNA